MRKWIAGALQVTAAFLFVAAGAEEEILFIPGAIAQLAGLALWNENRKATRALAEPETEPLDARLARMEDTLLGVQTDVAKLRDGREFMEELYGGQPQVTRGTPE